MAYDDIIVQRTASALEIAINRPDKLNALREQTRPRSWRPWARSRWIAPSSA